MNYIVAGWPRSATSSMMAALAAGGIPLYFCPKREAVLRERFPAQAGFFEPSAAQVRSTLFPADHAIKLLKDGPCKLQRGDYKVIFMRRDGHEIRQSLSNLLEEPFPYELGLEMEWDIQVTLSALRARRDMQVVEIRFESFIATPLLWFELLKDEGWALDPLKAANVIHAPERAVQ